MSMRRAALALSLVAGLAWRISSARADSFGGFSGVDRPYLVNQDRVCAPILVSDAAATGTPRCEKATADVIARLSIKPPIATRGSTAVFVAAAAGRTVTIRRKSGSPVVAWDAPDPIVKIVDVYASQYDDRVAVAYTVRRLGKEVTDVIGFDLRPGAALPPVKDPAADPAPPAADPAPPAADPATPPAVDPLRPPAPSDPQLAKAVAAARTAGKPAAWTAVLALDPDHPEALARTAGLAVARHPAAALATLTNLARSTRPDAIEWLVEARFDPAFAPLRADPAFRAAVGLDRKPATPYERLMGFGGQWEQTGTSCDRPEVRFTATRDRSLRIRIKTACEGRIFDSSFKGTWRLDAQRVVLQLPNKGKQLTAADEAACQFESAGDEDAMRCTLGRDLDFVVLPTRR
jgi:hypothetical protein